MSDNPYRAPRYKPGQPLTAKGLNAFTDASRAAPLIRNHGGLTRRTPSGQTFVPHATRSGGGGSALVYLEITASTSINEYTATIYDNPIDRVSVEVGVTVYAKQHDAGTIPNSASGKGFWAILGNDDKYYLTNYSVFYG